MPWGQPHARRPGEALAEAVRRYLNHPTTRNRDAMADALAEQDRIT